MYLANSVKYAGSSGMIERISADVFLKARIIHFPEFIETVMQPSRWLAKLPFPTCFLNFKNKWCALVQERKDSFIEGQNNGEYFLDFKVFWPSPNGFAKDPLDISVVVTKDGAVMEGLGGVEDGCVCVKDEDDKQLAEADVKAGVAAAMVCLTHITLLNCENIHLEKKDQTDDATNQRRIRQGKKPFYSYYVLDIDPGSSWSSVDYVRGDAHNRFHVRRGHFKQKKHGRYWWRPHSCGRKSLGTIVKDYRVDKVGNSTN